MLQLQEPFFKELRGNIRHHAHKFMVQYRSHMEPVRNNKKDHASALKPFNPGR